MKKMFGLEEAAFEGAKRMTGASGVYDDGAAGTKTGIMECTKISTEMGWREIGAVAVGDKVLTFDNGMQIVKSVHRSAVWSGEGDMPSHFWPMEVPAGVLGNTCTMRILPNQPILVESVSAEEVFGDPFALVPAAALEGIFDVYAVSRADKGEVITLEFEEDQVVYALCGGLFFCSAKSDLFSELFKTPYEEEYEVLDLECAIELLSRIKEEVKFAKNPEFIPLALAA